MSRGGFRQGAGRKKEYTEPVKKILLGLPESVLEELDQFAEKRKLSRPKACLLYTSPSPRDQRGSRMPSSA